MRDEGWTKELPWIGQYVLDEEGQPVRAQSLLSWGKWLQEHPEQCRLARDTVGDTTVSTIFLALDYDFRDRPHEPLLWETMIFGGDYNRYDQFQRRYTSREAALEGHKRLVQMLTS